MKKADSRQNIGTVLRLKRKSPYDKMSMLKKYIRSRQRLGGINVEKLKDYNIMKSNFQRLWVDSSKSFRIYSKRHPRHETEIITGNDSKARADEIANS